MWIVLIMTAIGCHTEKPPESSIYAKSEQRKSVSDKGSKPNGEPGEPIIKSDEEWKNELSAMEYNVLRKKGTERAFTGDLLDESREGVYTCAACGEALFESKDKFNSGTGWPSFSSSKESVAETPDNSLGMKRTEVLCNKCGGHLGHVFNDGPSKTGQRYCINSAAMDFVPEKENKKDKDKK